MLITEAGRSVRLVHASSEGPTLVVLPLAALALLGAASVDGGRHEDAQEHRQHQPAKTASVKIHVSVVIVFNSTEKSNEMLCS